MMKKSDILSYLAELDESLPEGGRIIHVRVGGGSALAFYWDDRGTRDIDVAYPTELPDDILEAAARIAAEHGLDHDWINTNLSALPKPRQALFAENVYRGKRFHIYVPDKETLLAMKISAARPRDLDDAVKLAKETGITKREEIEERLYYYFTTKRVESIKALNRKFIDIVVNWATREQR